MLRLSEHQTLQYSETKNQQLMSPYWLKLQFNDIIESRLIRKLKQKQLIYINKYICRSSCDWPKC